jgi:hypothetical protein
MSRWFRSYADTHRNPKVARLSDADFRLWHELLCVASENDGLIPGLEDLKHLLNRRLDHLSKALQRLLSGGLIDALDDGYAPRNWNERQYKSDTSTDRVQKFRAKRNVSVTPPDTDTDTEVVSSIEEMSVRTDPPLTKKEILEAWDQRMVPLGFPAVRNMTAQRERQLKARLKDSTIEDWQRAMDALERSPFLRGENDRGWRADFDFLLQPKSFTKLIEGAYDH